MTNPFADTRVQSIYYCMSCSLQIIFHYTSTIRQQPFSYLGGGWDFIEKNILMSYLTEKKIRFCTVAEKKYMLSPARIFFMEKCISVPHDRNNFFLLSFS